MDESDTELTGRAVGIWGFGLEGVSMARTATAAGAASIVAVDDAGSRPLDVPDDIADLTVFRGPDQLTRLLDCDVVFVSPGIPWRHPLFEELRKSGKRVSNAADWYMTRHGSQTIGVTGTKGKSTTASFLGHLLSQLGLNAVVAGNIGTPLSDLSPAADAVVVAELSSQQCALLTTSPAVAVITNLFEDHLDWHGDINAYHRAKANVFRNGARSLVCTTDALAVLERMGITNFPPVLRVVNPETVAVTPGESVMTYEHNVVNGALAVIAAEEITDKAVTGAQTDAAVRSFDALPHRLQTVRTTGSTRWIDDTLATTGESVVAALKAMRPGEHVALIVGGMDRALNYAQVDDYLRSGARRVTLIQAPTNGTAIGVGYAAEHPAEVHVVDSLEDAVRTAAELADVDVVLLSPGAASYDLFPNYKAKAAAYCGFIDGLPGAVGDRH
jgi:UDP-N-acetylmuramoylalanine--D-glutamate ligase